MANEENVLGTADYLAPEQALNSHEADSPLGHLQPRLHAVFPAHRQPAVSRKARSPSGC